MFELGNYYIESNCTGRIVIFGLSKKRAKKLVKKFHNIDSKFDPEFKGNRYKIKRGLNNENKTIS